MSPEWTHLRKVTAATQLRFLDAEAKTGITFAHIALKAKDRRKVARNTISARKAYNTITSRLSGVSPDTAELQELHKKVGILRQLLKQLGEKV